MNQGKDVSDSLKKLLASSYTLYLKTQNYHWNVTGPMFSTLHVLFENQYTEMAAALDEIAERIRALGDTAPGSFKEFERLSILESSTDPMNAADMISMLADDSERVVAVCETIISAADKNNDQATADMAIRRIDVLQKNIWMLKSHLE